MSNQDTVPAEGDDTNTNPAPADGEATEQPTDATEAPAEDSADNAKGETAA